MDIILIRNYQCLFYLTEMRMLELFRGTDAKIPVNG